MCASVTGSYHPCTGLFCGYKIRLQTDTSSIDGKVMSVTT